MVNHIDLWKPPYLQQDTATFREYKKKKISRSLVGVFVASCLLKALLQIAYAARLCGVQAVDDFSGVNMASPNFTMKSEKSEESK